MKNSMILGVITLCLCLTALQAATALQIVNVTAPTKIYEGDVLHLSFSSDEPAEYLMLKDGVELTTTKEYNEILDSQSAGLYKFTFIAKKNNQSVNTTRTVEVLDSTFSMTLLEPISTEYSKPIPIHIITSKPVTLCYVTKDAISQTLQKQNDTSYNGTLSLPDGVHTISVKCKLQQDIIAINKTIIVDTKPPTITLTPSGNTKDYPITLTATTDEVASCIYADQKLETQSGTTHKATLRPSAGAHTIEVICKDTLQNNATKATTFTLERPPTAKITVDDTNPHKAGTYEITLEVSEPLVSPPTLSLTFDNGGTKSIPLEKETETQYTGIIIIEDDAGERVGSFSFSGTGVSGLSGTTIDEAPLFIIDTIKPTKVQVFRAINSSNKVNLTWFYDGEDDVKFNIYRTTGEEVDYTDYYTGAVGNGYEDYQIGDAVTYYYRIAAVDDAGNIGPLSEEQSASPAKTQYIEEKQELILDPLLQIAVDTRVRELDTWILDAKRLSEDLKATTDPHKSKMLVELGILGEMQKQQATLQAIKEELLTLKKTYLDKATLEERMSSAFEKAIAARGAMPRSLSIENKIDYEETPSQQSLEYAAQAIQADLDASEELTDEAKIRTTLSHITIEYQDNTKKELSTIDKQLTFPQPKDRVLVAELLPEGIGKPTFIAPAAQKIKDDLYQMSYDTIQSERIFYTLEGTIDITRLRNTQLIPLREQREIEQQQENQITGNAILPDLSTIANTNTLAIIIGLIVVASLLFYYFRIQEDPIQSPLIQQPNHLPQIVQSQPTAPQQDLRKSTIVIERKDTHLTQLLMNGNMLIDQNKYLDALYFYKKSIEKYNAQDYTPQINLALKAELQLLYRKLLLSKEMSTAHDAVMAEDIKLLEQSMQNMREHAQIIGEESGIVQRAEHSYRYFFSQWNNLKVQRHNVDEQDL